MAKTQKLGRRFKLPKFFRRHITLDLKLPHRWLQILTDRDDVDVVVAQILQCGENFMLGLADAEHETGFGEDLRTELFSRFQEVQRALITMTRSEERRVGKECRSRWS